MHHQDPSVVRTGVQTGDFGSQGASVVGAEANTQWVL